MRRLPSVNSLSSSARGRTTVLVIGVLVLIPKLLIAARTYGTNDIVHWTAFAHGVASRGPVGIYEIHFHGSFYNHPPAIGYYLEVINKLARHGIPLKFTIRAVSSMADVASALLVFELLRRRRSLMIATLSGVLVAASPVLFLISGFHGNTDPVFTMFILLGSFLLVDKRAGLLGGAVLALALGVKLVPVVVLPSLFVYLFRRDRRTLVAALAGFTVAFLLTWGPALLSEWQPLRNNVLGYAGVPIRQWGLVQFGHWADNQRVVDLLVGPGKTLSVALSALVPAAFVWRRPDRILEAVGISLASFLAFSPAFGIQYIAWPLAAAFLVDFWLAALYDIVAGLFVFHIYDRWSGGFPWNVAHAAALTAGQVVFAVVVWASLLLVLGVGLRRLIDAQFSPGSHADPTPPPRRVLRAPRKQAPDGVPA